MMFRGERKKDRPVRYCVMYSCIICQFRDLCKIRATKSEREKVKFKRQMCVDSGVRCNFLNICLRHQSCALTVQIERCQMSYWRARVDQVGLIEDCTHATLYPPWSYRPSIDRNAKVEENTFRPECEIN